jgi:hypothetical protein
MKEQNANSKNPKATTNSGYNFPVSFFKLLLASLNTLVAVVIKPLKRKKRIDLFQTSYHHRQTLPIFVPINVL